MELVFDIIGCVLLAILGIIVLFFLIVGLKTFTWFNCRPCSNCEHTMEYKGLKEDGDNGHYLFHCKHCGAWKQIPKEEFFRDCSNDCNPVTL